MKTKTLATLKAEMLKNKGVRKAYDDLALEYAVARAVIQARTRCGITQAQLAERMQTSQSYIARLENARVLPTMKTFQKVAEATGTRVKFELEAVA